MRDNIQLVSVYADSNKKGKREVIVMAFYYNKLKKLRKGKGLSQAELAQQLGLGKSTIAMYEWGKRTPEFETIEAICDFFNVNMSELSDSRLAMRIDDYITSVAGVKQKVFQNSDLVEEHKAPQPAPDQMTIIRLALKDHPDVLKAIESADFATNTINLGDATINIDDIDLDYIKTSILSAIVMAKQKGENGKLEITVSPKAKLPDT